MNERNSKADRPIAAGPVNAAQENVLDMVAANTAYSVTDARDYDALRTIDPASRRIHQFERDILLDALQRVGKHARILEVGCGTGRLLTEGLAAGYHVDGIDASGPMLEQLKAKLHAEHPQIDLTLAEAANIPHPDQSYDLVYSIRVLNQTATPEYALSVVAEMIRLVRPGGYVLVEFCNAFRPRIGPARRNSAVRLRPAQVDDRGRRAGGTIVDHIGAFFVGMATYRAVPSALLPLVSAVDRGLSRVMPRLCSRTYALFQVPAARS